MSELLNVKMSKGLKEAAFLQAKIKYQTMSEYVRQLILADINSNEPNLVLEGLSSGEYSIAKYLGMDEATNKHKFTLGANNE